MECKDILDHYRILVSRCAYVRNQEDNIRGVSAQINHSVATQMTKNLAEYRILCKKPNKDDQDTTRMRELKEWFTEHRIQV